MNAGRELDALVTTHVFKWKREQFINFTVPAWSTDRALSWQVLDRLLELHWHWAMTSNFLAIENSKTGQRLEFLEGNSLSERVCIAALKAVEKDLVFPIRPPARRLQTR